MYLHAGPEIGVASTKAFTCQAIQILVCPCLVANMSFFKTLNSRARLLPFF